MRFSCVKVREDRFFIYDTRYFRICQIIDMYDTILKEEFIFKKGREVHMNILVLGNGFDLAHGLPTKYTDFLEWVKAIERLNDCESQLGVRKCISNNFWIEYFMQNPMYQKENWIDFESEISNVIQNIDEGMQRRSDKIDNTISSLDNKYLSNKFLDSQIDLISQALNGRAIENKKNPITYNQLKLLLENDLNRLVRSLEIYISNDVFGLKIEKKLSDIQKLDIDHVLSFNYTDTYERIYGKGKEIDYDYIHGKADIENTLETNNMVLGIDEYLPDDRKDKDIEFIAFKKYYQRIYKGTGSKYKKWIDEIKRDLLHFTQRNERAEQVENNRVGNELQAIISKHAATAIRHEKCKIHHLYIFGHSLDVTDKDILRDLILNDNVYTTIFYHSKKELGRKIANLVKVIGQDELIRRTGGKTKTIEFKLQQDMVPIEE